MMLKMKTNIEVKKSRQTLLEKRLDTQLGGIEYCELKCYSVASSSGKIPIYLMDKLTDS